MRARTYIVVGVLIVAVGVAGPLLVQRYLSRRTNMAAPLPHIPPATEGVGGYECGYGKCRDAPDLAKCLSCCADKCTDVEGCTEFCLDWHGAKAAIAELGAAATGLKDGTITDPNARALAIGLIEKLQFARLKYVADAAVALAKTLPMVQVRTKG